MQFWYCSTSFFISSEKKLIGCSWSHVWVTCLFGHPTHTNFTLPQHHCRNLSNRDSSVFLDEGIQLLDEFLRSRWWLASRSTFVVYTCTFLYKAFYPLLHISLIHCVCSVLCQHPSMALHTFESFDPQKTEYGALFHLLCAASIQSTSLLPANWLGDRMLRSAS